MKSLTRKASKKTTAKASAGKTWTEKLLDETKMVQVKKIEKAFADIPANSNMLIATPGIVDAYIRQIPKGSATNLLTMRRDLAHDFKADHTCPVTTGIFLRIVAEAAYEQVQQGRALSRITPFWRLIDEKSPLLKKFSFGGDFVLQQRKKEGLLAKPTE